MTIRTITFCALFWAAVALGNVILTSDPASITWVSGGGNNLVAVFAAESGPVASGGDTVTTNAGYIIHTFTTVGTTNFIVSSGSITCDVLVVAGGGGAGGHLGGGGGAGGLI